MNFELLLSGKLPTGKGNKKHSELRKNLRSQIDRQLRALWRNKPLSAYDKLTKPGSTYSAIHSKHDLTFICLASKQLKTACLLKFVMYEPSGSLEVTSDVADPDNRLAGLLDILSIPTTKEAAEGFPNPLYTLMEDDKLVWSIAVERRRLLRKVESQDFFTRLEVQVIPTEAILDSPALINIPAH